MREILLSEKSKTDIISEYTKMEYKPVEEKRTISAANVEECKVPAPEVDIYRDTPLRYVSNQIFTLPDQYHHLNIIVFTLITIV